MLYFIVNTTSKSGKGKEVWKEIRGQLSNYSLPYKAFRTKYEGHATWLAKKICQLDDEDINIIVVGGDGTVNEVVNGITDFSKVKFGVIPAGSGNDFARMGVDIKIKCKNCGREIMMDRLEFQKKIKRVVENEK